MAYDYFRDRFSVEANDPVQQDEQVQSDNNALPSANLELFSCI